jgi:hypothetical protein
MKCRVTLEPVTEGYNATFRGFTVTPHVSFPELAEGRLMLRVVCRVFWDDPIMEVLFFTDPIPEDDFSRSIFVPLNVVVVAGEEAA